MNPTAPAHNHPPRDAKIPDLTTDLAGIRMRNPVMVASGTFGYGPEYAELVDYSQLGALVVKGISLRPAAGNRPPRTVETVGGLVNAIGLQNPGVDGFIREYLPFLRKQEVPVLVNIWGRTLEEYAAVAGAFEGVEGVHGLEVNVSCPNIKEGGNLFGTDLRLFREAVAAVRRNSTLPILVKLSPNVPRIADFALAAGEEGADGISLINSLPALVVDVERRRPVLGNGTGGLTGPAIHPVALKLVWEAARATTLPVVGMGGIAGPREALAFLIAGARAVAVGTATFRDPRTALDVVKGLREYLLRHGLASIRELVGSLTVDS